MEHKKTEFWKLNLKKNKIKLQSNFGNQFLKYIKKTCIFFI